MVIQGKYTRTSENPEVHKEIPVAGSRKWFFSLQALIHQVSIKLAILDILHKIVPTVWAQNFEGEFFVIQSPGP